jgi:hypothetical protein
LWCFHLLKLCISQQASTQEFGFFFTCKWVFKSSLLCYSRLAAGLVAQSCYKHWQFDSYSCCTMHGNSLSTLPLSFNSMLALEISSWQGMNKKEVVTGCFATCTLAQCPATASNVQFDLLCCQPRPVPETLSTRTFHFTM